MNLFGGRGPVVTISTLISEDMHRGHLTRNTYWDGHFFQSICYPLLNWFLVFLFCLFFCFCKFCALWWGIRPVSAVWTFIPWEDTWHLVLWIATLRWVKCFCLKGFHWFYRISKNLKKLMLMIWWMNLSIPNTGFSFTKCAKYLYSFAKDNFSWKMSA